MDWEASVFLCSGFIGDIILGRQRAWTRISLTSASKSGLSCSRFSLSSRTMSKKSWNGGCPAPRYSTLRSFPTAQVNARYPFPSLLRTSFSACGWKDDFEPVLFFHDHLASGDHRSLDGRELYCMGFGRSERGELASLSEPW